MSQPEPPDDQAAPQEPGSQAAAPGEAAAPGQAAGPGQAGLPRGGHRLPDPWRELMRIAGQLADARPAGAGLPSWRRPTRGGPRRPVSLRVSFAVVLELLLPDRLPRPLPHYLLPILEGALL